MFNILCAECLKKNKVNFLNLESIKNFGDSTNFKMSCNSCSRTFKYSESVNEIFENKKLLKEFFIHGLANMLYLIDQLHLPEQDIDKIFNESFLTEKMMTAARYVDSIVISDYSTEQKILSREFIALYKIYANFCIFGDKDIISEFFQNVADEIYDILNDPELLEQYIFTVTKKIRLKIKGIKQKNKIISRN